ncbi:hypothetical protein EBR21_02980 [bacterium]|nr:hypothetical protein [bacterium]
MSLQKTLNKTQLIQRLSSSRFYFVMAIIPSIITLIAAAAIVIFLGERDRRANLFESQMLKTRYISSEVKERLVRQLHNPEKTIHPVTSKNPVDFGLPRFPQGSEVFVFAATPGNSPFARGPQSKRKFGVMYKSNNQLVVSELLDNLDLGSEDNTQLLVNRSLKINLPQDDKQKVSEDSRDIQPALDSKAGEGTFGHAEKGTFKVVSFRTVDDTNIQVITSQTLSEYFSYYKTPLLILLATFTAILTLALVMQKIIQTRFKKV